MLVWCRLSLVGIVLVIASASVQAQTQTDKPLAAHIEEIIRRPEFKQAHWGLLVVDSKTGDVVYEHNPDQLFIPASTTKIYSCAAALMALGSNYRFETPVYRRGEAKEGRLAGDLILVGSGDPTLGGRTHGKDELEFKDSDHIYANGNTRAEICSTDPLAGLRALARQVHDAGIKEVSGDVLVDDRLFVHARGTGSGPAVISPIMVNDNCVDILITPAAEAGKSAKVEMHPRNAFFHMDADVTTTAADSKRTAVTVNGTGFRSFKVRGQIPIRPKPLVRIFPVQEPAAFARALFIDELRQQGVRITASPFEEPKALLPEFDKVKDLPRVALLTSPPFSELIKIVLKVSHNLYASELPLLVAVKNGKRTLNEGLRAQGKLLAENGVDISTISFGGGAGGDDADAVTPRASTQLLRGFSKRPEYAALLAGMPVLGVDGTLFDVVPADSPARGKVRAKTGTMYWDDGMNNRILLTGKALAGVMTTARGRELTFGFYVNMVPLPPGVEPTREGKVLGKIAELVFEHAP